LVILSCSHINIHANADGVARNMQEGGQGGLNLTRNVSNLTH